MNMEEKIKEAISNDLPNQVAEALQLKLKQADADKANVARLQSDLKAATKREVELTKTSTELRVHVLGQDKLTEREADVRVAENKLAVTLAEAKAAAAEDKCATILLLTTKVFGHPRVMVHNDGYRDVKDAQGYSTPINHSDSTTTTEGKD